MTVTLLILEKGVPAEFVPFHLVSTVALWVTLVVTVLSGVDYFYGFFLRTDTGALVKEKERWP